MQLVLAELCVITNFLLIVIYDDLFSVVCFRPVLGGRLAWPGLTL